MSSALPTTWSIHYRCAFDLAAAVPGQLTWATLVKTVRAWIKEKENSETLRERIAKGWFFDAGEYRDKVGRRRVHIRTLRFIGVGSIDDPEIWAVRYEHGDDDPTTFRSWRTDIAVASHGKSQYRFALQVSYSLHSEFVGAEPPRPAPSAPRLVTRLLTSKHWVATAGSAVLSAGPEVLRVGQGRELVLRLADNKRRCPLLLLSGDPATNLPKLDAGRLARVLAGTVQVVVATGSEFEEELAYELPHMLRCSKGTVRLYLPGVRMEDTDADAGRHRFVKASEIDEVGSAVIEDRLISTIGRRLAVGLPDTAWGLEDVERRGREARFAALRAQVTAAGDKELLQLFEEDNVALQRELARLKTEKDELEALLDQRENELADTEARTRRLAFELETARAQVEAAEADARTVSAGASALEAVPAPPASAVEVILWVTSLWGDRVVFTDRARKSAEKASINQDKSELPAVWRLIRSLAIHLHPLTQQPGASTGWIAEEYQRRSGFGLAWTEGKQTKKDNKLMQARRLDYDGEILDITPHVKHGSKPPKCLRVHFAVHQRSGKVIVGHCGDHLDTYGTQRLS